MKKLFLTLIITVTALAAVSCSDDPSDKVVGSYNCTVNISTRYSKAGEWRDTTYTRGNGTLTLGKIDESTVYARVESPRLDLDETFEVVRLNDWHNEANLSTDKDSVYIQGHQYKADFSGTVVYESHAVAVSLRVNNYPNSNGKYIISLTNSSY